MEKAARRVSQAFIQGLAWSLAYYTRGSALPSPDAPKGEGFSTGASWEWCAPRRSVAFVLCARTCGSSASRSRPAELAQLSPASGECGNRYKQSERDSWSHIWG